MRLWITQTRSPLLFTKQLLALLESSHDDSCFSAVKSSCGRGHNSCDPARLCHCMSKAQRLSFIGGELLMCCESRASFAASSRPKSMIGQRGKSGKLQGRVRRPVPVRGRSPSSARLETRRARSKGEQFIFER